MTHDPGCFLLALLALLVLRPSVALAEPDYADLFRQYETQYGLPPLLAYAVAHQESGRHYNGKFQPFPWAVNISGRGYYFNTKKEAISAAKKALAKGKSFDGGLMQQAWRWQKHRYSSPEDVFEPEINIRIGAQILRELYDQTGSWVEAIARYHVGTVSDPTELKRALNYAEKVRRYHYHLIDD